MKTKIIILTLIFILAGSVVLGFTIVNMTKDEAYKAAEKNYSQFEINSLNLELRQMAHDKSLKTASIPALNNYYGQITKRYNPFVSETNLEAEKMIKERAYSQLEFDLVSLAINCENAATDYNEAETGYNKAKQLYFHAVNSPGYSDSEKLTLKYTMKNSKIAFHRAQNKLNDAQRLLDTLTDTEGTRITLPKEYSDPYKISAEDAFNCALKTDTGIYKSRRYAEASSIKFKIASEYFNEDEELYKSTLADTKSAELSYSKALLRLEMNVYDDIDNLKNQYDAISLAKLNKKIRTSAYEIAKSQYKTGIIALAGFENIEQAYINSVTQLNEKISAYILLSMRFTLNYGYNF